MNQEKEKYRKFEDSLKEEQDKKIAEINANYEKEKNNYKKKIAEIEKSLREAEGKRGALLLESEKEKAKWDIEKDNLYNKVSELNDRITSLEKKNEGLLRENERLKNEKNMLRNRGKNNDTIFTSHLGSGLRSKLDNSIYRTSMMKALGDNSDDKSETSEKSSKFSTKIEKKEETKK